MRNGMLIICVAIMASCTKKDDVVKNDNLYGKWQKVAESYPAPSDGFGGWAPVENGYTITFKTNGSIEDSRNNYIAFEPGNGDSILLKANPASGLADKWFRYRFEPNTAELILNDPIAGFYPVMDKLKPIK